ncbi:type II toxin-antitoxin system VapC family toxin [Thiohalocapsa marina]|uniref:Type II toxin-antitoxin system VapC family toxin n=1 Tax=Thiohalocapsa marina TaxID=424902 RepID=A0A5M8FJ08_9GAMM|nr:PIN domain-containing protein [Thiohalocapsa marina]KAA6183716.1 type II toxin-antitoxin system VapC family toxin [Thiohalocapsa marina]
MTQDNRLQRRVYLDLCCFNRPYDDQRFSRIHLETEAKLLIQERIREGLNELVWSSVLDYENAQNPFPERRYAIQQWRWLAKQRVVADVRVREKAKRLIEYGIKDYDALHVASAIIGGAQLFVTTDDRLLNRLRKQNDIVALLPGDALALLENWYEN